MSDKSITSFTNIPSSLQNEMSLIISNAFTESQKMSKELYTEKLKLITSAKDMSTAEKLTAMNDSYSTWYQQNWQNQCCISKNAQRTNLAVPNAKKPVQKEDLTISNKNHYNSYPFIKSAFIKVTVYRHILTYILFYITMIQGVHRRTKRQVKNPHAGPSAIRLRGLLSFLFPILSHSVPCGKT